MQENTSTPTTAVATAVPVPQASAPTSNRAALLIVFLVVFIDLLGFGIVLPLLPVIGDNYIGQIIEGGKESPLGGLILGLMMASFSLMQFLVAPIWGRLSDRVGRRPILLLGLGGSVAFYCLFGYACTLPAATHAQMALFLLFVSRIGAGLAGATIGTAQAVIADSTPPEKRKHGMALIGAAFGIGFTFGPLIALLTLVAFEDYLGVVGYVAAGLSLVALVLGIRLLPETRKFSDAPTMNRKWVDMSALRGALRNTSIGPVILTFFLASLGFAAFETTLALFLQDILGFDKVRMCGVFAFVGFVLVLTQGVYRPLAKRLTEPTFMTLGISFMALGLLGLGAVIAMAQRNEGSAPAMPLVFVALAAAVFGFGFLTPSAQALVSRRTEANMQGEILGVNQSASAMARILGPPIGLTLLKVNPLLPYAFGAALLLLMLPMMPRIRRG